MKQLLADYIFSDTLRYENHRLIYGSTAESRMELGGFLGAAVLGALLYGKDESRERNIILNTSEGRKQFFKRYEDETLQENGGYFNAEVQTLSEAYIELNGDLTCLFAICGNERLYDLAFGLMVDYMEMLVEEQVREHIYDLVPWTQPFAQWLYDAGFVETRRQHLLAIDWTDPAEVYTLSEEITNQQLPITNNTSPTFVFNDLSADQVLNGYWEWLWNAAQTEANLYPDSKVRLAEYKEKILKDETEWGFIKPEMKDFSPEQINLFREWMNQWTNFVKSKIEPPVSTQKKNMRQELFLDNVLPVPPEHNYVKVREYIFDRCRYDQEFKKYFKAHKRTDFCDQLTLLFGWYVDPNALGKRMNSKPKK